MRIQQQQEAPEQRQHGANLPSEEPSHRDDENGVSKSTTPAVLADQRHETAIEKIFFVIAIFGNAGDAF